MCALRRPPRRSWTGRWWIDRLRQVGVAARGQAALAVAAHGVSGDRDHRNRGDAGRERSSAISSSPEASGRFMSSSTTFGPAAPTPRSIGRAAPRRSSRAPRPSPPRRAGTRPARSSGRCPQPPTRACPSLRCSPLAPLPRPPLRELRRDSSSRSTSGSRFRSSGALLPLLPSGWFR